VHPEVAEEILPYCLFEGIGTIVYSPMASGLLTGAMTRERISKLPEDDWRKHHPDFNEPALSTNLALVERLRDVGKRQNVPPGAVAIAWTLRHPGVTGAIVGARKPEQADEAVAAADVHLSELDLTDIGNIAKMAA
jgi:aryl-alcohol dehydrogenase-like predicted oxidoreductase